MKKNKSGCLGLLLKFLLMWLFIVLLMMGFRLFREYQAAQSGKELEVSQEIPFQEDSEGEESFALHYYYSLLSDGKEKKIYREIYQGMKNREDEIYIHCRDANQANRILGEV